MEAYQNRFVLWTIICTHMHTLVCSSYKTCNYMFYYM